MTEVTPGALHHQFENLEQQNETASIGMWAFLAQELMFFGGAFCAYVVYRAKYTAGFAEASPLLDVPLAMTNTIVLIGSSLTMATAVREAQLGRRQRCALLIAATMLLACTFLGIKAFEYSHKWHDELVPGLHWNAARFHNEGAGTFFFLYFFMTGLHALHMIIGLPIMTVVALRALRGRYSKDNYIGVEVLGLYWHFVDLVWIFLFPLFYLLGAHG